MKHLILITILTISFSCVNVYSNICNTTCYEYNNVNDIGRDFYNRLAISQRIVEYTNRHIETKASKRGSIPTSLINEIQSSVDYSSFINDVISIMSDNYTSTQMEQAINNSVDLPYIAITSPKIKKDLNEAVIRFWNTVDISMSQILSNNGF